VNLNLTANSKRILTLTLTYAKRITIRIRVGVRDLRAAPITPHHLTRGYALQEALVEEIHKFRAIQLGSGMEFMHKLKKLAASRSPEGSEFMSKEDVVRELVRCCGPTLQVRGRVSSKSYR